MRAAVSGPGDPAAASGQGLASLQSSIGCRGRRTAQGTVAPGEGCARASVDPASAAARGTSLRSSSRRFSSPRERPPRLRTHQARGLDRLEPSGLPSVRVVEPRPISSKPQRAPLQRKIETGASRRPSPSLRCRSGRGRTTARISRSESSSKGRAAPDRWPGQAVSGPCSGPACRPPSRPGRTATVSELEPGLRRHDLASHGSRPTER